MGETYCYRCSLLPWTSWYVCISAVFIHLETVSVRTFMTVICDHHGIIEHKELKPVYHPSIHAQEAIGVASWLNTGEYNVHTIELFRTIGNTWSLRTGDRYFHWSFCPLLQSYRLKQLVLLGHSWQWSPMVLAIASWIRKSAVLIYTILTIRKPCMASFLHYQEECMQP